MKTRDLGVPCAIVKASRVILDDPTWGDGELVTLTITKREGMLMSMINGWFTSVPEELIPDKDPVGFEVSSLQRRINESFGVPGYEEE